MPIKNAYHQYKENSVFTASPEELTLMLYNGLIKFIMQARNAIDERSIEKTNSGIIRAEEIIIEFRATLDMKHGISHELDLIYEYIYTRLIDANIKKDKVILDEVLDLAKDLRDTWAQAMKLAKQQSRPQQIAK